MKYQQSFRTNNPIYGFKELGYGWTLILVLATIFILFL